ncbi:MAG: methyltransferase domain-containing protein, partial [Desulfomonile tiedjei]|nr:methyltransferase domain-containing protein [Desulfomonile tiedjei]
MPIAGVDEHTRTRATPTYMPITKEIETNSQSEWRLSRCPVCGSEEITYAFRIVERRSDECSSCGLLFLNPQPTDAELQEIYSEGYLLGERDERLRDRVPGMRRAGAAILLRSAMEYLGIRDGRGKSLIDMGCGAGFLLEEAESLGFAVTGIDVSQELVERAASRLKKGTVHQGSVLDLDIPEQTFDVCVLSDVIEHMRNPAEALAKARNVLKQGGVAVVATPSLDSFTARVMQDRWMELKLEHLFYFRPANLQQLIYRSGFSCIRMHPHEKVLDLEYIRSHFERFPGNSVVGWAIRTCGNLVPRFLRERPITLGGSGMVALAARDDRQSAALRTVSVIVPVYNEVATFPNLIKQLTRKTIPGMDMEIVIVESNSTDGTREQVLQLQGQPGIK